MQLELWMWGAFGAFVVLMLLVDLVAFGQRGEEISLRRAGSPSMRSWASTTERSPSRRRPLPAIPIKELRVER